MRAWRTTWCAAAIAALAAAPAAAQPTAAEIVAQSVKAHGGDALTSWQTLKITGTVVMQDGIAYTGAYTLMAKAPDRLRVEHDATADRGRAFYDYFLNGGVAWSRRNLIPGTLEVDRIQRWMDQCYGIAFYARPGVAVELMPEGTIDWPPRASPDPAPAAPAAARKVWVVAATVGTERRELFIEQETARLLQEVAPQSTRVYWDFKTFDGMLMPTRILEITKTRQGETRTPFTWTDVTRNAPIEDWRFTEDMPRR
jgi:outer membrane lipoprotein-sorting protein